jgi:LPXTG-motif cell wall-anchored protein
MTLTNNASTTADLDYTLIDTMPSQFTIGQVTDAGRFEGCEVDNQQHEVTCSAFISLDAGDSTSVTFEVTPTNSGSFDNAALFTWFVPAQQNVTKAHRNGLKPAGGNPIGGTAHDAIRVVPAVTTTPTPTPTHTPTPTPTHTATHHPTHKPTPTPSTSVKSSSQTLPNTGSSDLGVLALVGMSLVVVGGVFLAATRSRRTGS